MFNLFNMDGRALGLGKFPEMVKQVVLFQNGYTNRALATALYSYILFNK